MKSVKLVKSQLNKAVIAINGVKLSFELKQGETALELTKRLRKEVRNADKANRA